MQWFKLRRPKRSSQIDLTNRWAPSLLVAALYRVAYGSLPGDLALEDGLQCLRTGSVDDLALSIVVSASFKKRHGSGDDVGNTFLLNLYRNAFGAEPKPEWFESICAAETKELTRAEALISIAHSEEVLLSLVQIPLRDLVGADRPTQLIHSLYHTSLGRYADQGGLTGYLRYFRKKGAVEKIARSLTDSPEFQRRHGPGQKIDFKFIMDLYRDAFYRQPALEELSSWLAHGEKGASRADVIAALALSEEALRRLQPEVLTSSERYSRWIKNNDTINEADRIAIRSLIGELPFHPFFSVTLISGSSSHERTRESLASMRNQLYSNWELSLIVDPQSESLLHDELDDFRKSGMRLVRVDTGSSEAAKLNAALNLTVADYVTFLRAGDRFREQTLYELAVVINKEREVDIIYTDRDRIDLTGRRSDPWFKPGWDPDLLLAQDYLNDLAVYRRELVKELGFLRSGFEGAELYDLALRATATTSSARIRHIPAILYHRLERGELGNPKTNHANRKRFAAIGKVVRNHLDSQGYTSASISEAPGLSGALRVRWRISEPPPLVSVIIPTRDRGDLVAKCIEGLLHRTAYPDLEILIVDNGSTEVQSLSLFERLPKENSNVRYLACSGPFNYAALTNLGARASRGEVLLLLNNDIEVIEPGWLEEMVSQAIRPDVGAVGAKLLYPEGQIQHAGIVLGPSGGTTHLHRFDEKSETGYFGQLVLTRTLSAVTAACLAVRRRTFFEVGGLDEVNLAVSYNDVDLCLKLGQHGYRVVWTPFAVLYHLESVSRGKDDATPFSQDRSEKEWIFLRQKWAGLLENDDPFHNPNLLFDWGHLEIPSFPRRIKPWYSLFDRSPRSESASKI